SGSMANGIAVACHARHGDDIIASVASHVFDHEGGSYAALCGCTANQIPSDDGLIEPTDLEHHLHPQDVHFSPTRLFVIENTHNAGGGTPWTLDRFRAVTFEARRLGLAIHMDGARIWNACAATGVAPDAFASTVDSVSCCFSKGLGAPVGSALVGDRAFIEAARYRRKIQGGSMRQAGLLAACALHALEHHRDRLPEDHANATRLASGLASLGLRVRPAPTNIVYFDVEDAVGFCETLDRVGVRMLWMDRTKVRAVTHLDVSALQIEEAIEAIGRVVRG
ncbi:MAG: hypothetical protein KDA28_07820, partial [Phycisphaerales bacterium]|nr:hypothetical protein [Phycisphaerales bacterium]